MFDNGNCCSECIHLTEQLQESLNKIANLETKLKKTTTEDDDSIKNPEFISNFLIYKNENTVLKKQLSELKGNTSSSKNLTYEMKVLKSKLHEEKERNQSLLETNKQLNHFVEQNKMDSDRSEIQKIKKELREKERKIAELSLLNEQLRKQRDDLNKNAFSNLPNANHGNEFLEKIGKDSFLSSSQPQQLLNDINLIEGNGNKYDDLLVEEKCREIKTLLDEVEFLKRKYRKYQTKYIKFKSKYNEVKEMHAEAMKMIKIFSSLVENKGLISGRDQFSKYFEKPKRKYSETESEDSDANIEESDFNGNNTDNENNVGKIKSTSEEGKKNDKNQSEVVLLGKKRNSHSDVLSMDKHKSSANDSKECGKPNDPERKERNNQAEKVTKQVKKAKKEGSKSKMAIDELIENEEEKKDLRLINFNFTSTNNEPKEKEEEEERTSCFISSKLLNLGKNSKQSNVVVDKAEPQTFLNKKTSSNTKETKALQDKKKQSTAEEIQDLRKINFNFNSGTTSMEESATVSNKLQNLFKSKSNEVSSKNTGKINSKLNPNINEYYREDPPKTSYDTDWIKNFLAQANSNPQEVDLNPKKLPIKKEKKQIENPILKKQETQENLITFINSIEPNEKSISEIDLFLSKMNKSTTAYELTSEFMETVINSITKINFIKLLLFLKSYLRSTNDFNKYYDYISEFLEQSSVLILNSKTELIVIDSEISNAIYSLIFQGEEDFGLKEIFLGMLKSLSKTKLSISFILCFLIIVSAQTLIKKELNSNSSTQYIDISSMISRLYKVVMDNFLQESLNSENLLVIKTLVSPLLNIQLPGNKNMTVLADLDLKFSKEQEVMMINNRNKILYFEVFARKAVSSSTIGFINYLIDIDTKYAENLPDFLIYNHNDSDKSLLGQYFKRSIEQKLKEINSETTLNESVSDKINFLEDRSIVELSQLVYLISRIKGVNWSFDHIFSNILCDSFTDSNDGSIKRLAILFSTCQILSFICSKERLEHVYNHEIIEYLYSIVNPTICIENKITAYDKIISIFGLCEITKTKKHLIPPIQTSLMSIVHTYGVELIPSDLLEKLIKLKIYIN